MGETKCGRLFLELAFESKPPRLWASAVSETRDNN